MHPLSTALLRWYKKHGRKHLPWRQTRDPYRVLVSEFMLQQTQVERVLPKYAEFIERFPDLRSLAAARSDDVQRLWKGLGYNSRAIRLHRVAREAVEKFNGELPNDAAALKELPGIGPYTVAAVRAFAFNERAAAMDTNIRRIVHRTLHGVEFPAAATNAQLDAQAFELVPPDKSHDWNSAMMDLGSLVCTARAPKCLICPLRDNCAAAPVDAAQLELLRKQHATPASPQERLPFLQTTRFARGRIVDALRALPHGERISLLDLHAQLNERIKRTPDDFDAIIRALARDGIVSIDAGKVALAH